VRIVITHDDGEIEELKGESAYVLVINHKPVKNKITEEIITLPHYHHHQCGDMRELTKELKQTLGELDAKST